MSSPHPACCAVLGGGGSLGRLVVAELALAGMRVFSFGPDRHELQQGVSQARQEVSALIRRNLLDDSDLKLFMDNITVTTNMLEAVASADFIFECIPEDLNMKRSLYAQFAPLVKRDAIVATSSMSLSISELASCFPGDKQRFMGIRFLFPVVLIAQVEVTPGLETSQMALEHVKSFLLSMHKEPFFKQPGGGRFLRLTQHEVAHKQSEAAEARRLLRQRTAQQANDLMRARRSAAAVYSGDGHVPVVPSAPPTSDSYTRPPPTAPGTSAATTTNPAPTAAPQPPAPAPTADGEEESLDPLDRGMCCVCITDQASTVCLPCGHMCLCLECSTRYQESSSNCPVCRVRLQNIIRVFKC